MKELFRPRRFSSAGLFLLAGTILAASPLWGDTPSIPAGGMKTPIPETGLASYYGTKYHGGQTASGEVFNMNALTAAHPRLAFGTRVRVTHLTNHKTVTVRINDRGPFVKGRVIDLSQAAASELHMIDHGLATVKIEILE